MLVIVFLDEVSSFEKAILNDRFSKFLKEHLFTDTRTMLSVKTVLLGLKETPVEEFYKALGRDYFTRRFSIQKKSESTHRKATSEKGVF